MDLCHISPSTENDDESRGKNVFHSTLFFLLFFFAAYKIRREDEDGDAEGSSLGTFSSPPVPISPIVPSVPCARSSAILLAQDVLVGGVAAHFAHPVTSATRDSDGSPVSSEVIHFNIYSFRVLEKARVMDCGLSASKSADCLQIYK